MVREQRHGRRLVLGKVVETATIHTWCEGHPLRRTMVMNALIDHSRCDWGEALDDEDWAQNNFALDNEERILSAYTIDHQRVWIITEWDRSVTTILFPSDY